MLCSRLHACTEGWVVVVMGWGWGGDFFMASSLWLVLVARVEELPSRCVNTRA